MPIPPFPLAASAGSGLLSPFGLRADACCPGGGPAPTGLPARRRARLHELDARFHCSIIGTCLSTHALRKAIARHVETRGADDSEVHHDAVALAGEAGPASKALHKALDQCHAQVLLRFARLAGPECLADAWKKALAEGNVPGAYWAVVTHPDATEELRRRAFGDVHMLSHLVGAANRADIRRLAALQQENARLQERIDDQQLRAREALAEREATIADLQRQLADERLRALAVEGVLQRESRGATQQAAAGERNQLALQVQRREQAEQAMAAAQQDARRLQSELEALVDRDRTLHAELAALEEQYRATLDPATTGPAALADRLHGRRILYVGGRPSSAAAIRDVVQRHGGSIQRHDGGLEDRKGLLAAAVAGADLVAFPVDCIDHDSAGHLKRVCARHGIAFLALRTASVGSFLAGIAAIGKDGAATGQRPPICLRHG